MQSRHVGPSILSEATGFGGGNLNLREDDLFPLTFFENIEEKLSSVGQVRMPLSLPRHIGDSSRRNVGESSHHPPLTNN